MSSVDDVREQIQVRTPIRLGQFLKLANVVMDGAEAKDLIASGSVSVNGTRCIQRGAHLNAGDTVDIAADGLATALVVTERS